VRREGKVTSQPRARIARHHHPRLGGRPRVMVERGDTANALAALHRKVARFPPVPLDSRIPVKLRAELSSTFLRWWWWWYSGPPAGVQASAGAHAARLHGAGSDMLRREVETAARCSYSLLFRGGVTPCDFASCMSVHRARPKGASIVSSLLSPCSGSLPPRCLTVMPLPPEWAKARAKDSWSDRAGGPGSGPSWPKAAAPRTQTHGPRFG
jgi:hypothetical protein